MQSVAGLSTACQEKTRSKANLSNNLKNANDFTLMSARKGYNVSLEYQLFCHQLVLASNYYNSK